MDDLNVMSMPALMFEEEQQTGVGVLGIMQVVSSLQVQHGI
jgi:hypothetical protein